MVATVNRAFFDERSGASQTKKCGIDRKSNPKDWQSKRFYGVFP